QFDRDEIGRIEVTCHHVGAARLERLRDSGHGDRAFHAIAVRAAHWIWSIGQNCTRESKQGHCQKNASHEINLLITMLLKQMKPNQDRVPCLSFLENPAK